MARKAGGADAEIDVPGKTGVVGAVAVATDMGGLREGGMGRRRAPAIDFYYRVDVAAGEFP